MAVYGSDDLKIEFDNSAGSLVDMSAYVLEINGVDVQAIVEELTAFGKTFEEWLYVGVKKLEEIELTGVYDDTASTGPNVVFNSLGDTRTLKVTWGSTKTTTVEAIIRSYQRLAKSKETTKYKAVLRPTGAVVEV